MNFCKDCKHYDNFNGHCLNKLKSIDPIDGYKHYVGASWERSYYPAHLRPENHCGPEGKFFEPIPKLSFFSYIKSFFGYK
jgi:hypothetical protein